MQAKTQLTLEFEHRAALGYEDFLVTDANNKAVYCLDTWQQWPGGMLLIIGPLGCGKSHLSAVFSQATGAKLISDQELDDSKGIDCASDFSVFENCDQGLTVNREEALLHLFNSVKEQNSRLLLTAKTPPSRWNIELKDLSSRMNTVTQIVIKEPDDALMTALLVKLFADRQLKIDAPIINYIIKRIERSFDAARTLVEYIDLKAMQSHRSLSVQFVGKMMRELHSSQSEDDHGFGING